MINSSIRIVKTILSVNDQPPCSKKIICDFFKIKNSNSHKKFMCVPILDFFSKLIFFRETYDTLF